MRTSIKIAKHHCSSQRHSATVCTQQTMPENRIEHLSGSQASNSGRCRSTGAMNRTEAFGKVHYHNDEHGQRVARVADLWPMRRLVGIGRCRAVELLIQFLCILL